MGNVDFNNALYLTQHVQSILTCNQYKLGYFTHIVLDFKSSKSSVHLLHISVQTGFPLMAQW